MLWVNKGTVVLLYLRSYLQEACFVYNLLSIVFFFGVCIKHGASGRGCCPVNGQHVHAPNTSLSNLSVCQQHMFCKKLPVGARGKDRSCQTIEEMLPPHFLSHCGGFSNAHMFSPEPSLSSSPELQKFELRDPWGTSSSFLFLLFLLLLPLSLG